MYKDKEARLFDLSDSGQRANVAQLAGVFLEHGLSKDILKRVNISEMVTRGGVLEMNFDKRFKFAEAEKEATLNLLRLAGEGYNLIFWVSPADGEVYGEGRFNIYVVRKKGEEIRIGGRGIPLAAGMIEAGKLGRDLKNLGGKTVAGMRNQEDIRRQPIGFRIGRTDDWIGICREMLPEFEDFWDYFEAGEEGRRKVGVIKEVEAALAVSGNSNVLFEMEMRRRGLWLMAGNHGSGYLGSGLEVISFELRVMGWRVYTEAVRKNGKYYCPVCGEELGEGRAVCGKCGVRVRR